MTQPRPGTASGTDDVAKHASARSNHAASHRTAPANRNLIGAIGGRAKSRDAACRDAGLAGVDTSGGAASSRFAKTGDVPKSSDAASRSATRPRPGAAGRTGEVTNHESARSNNAASRRTAQARGASDDFKTNPPTRLPSNAQSRVSPATPKTFHSLNAFPAVVLSALMGLGAIKRARKA